MANVRNLAWKEAAPARLYGDDFAFYVEIPSAAYEIIIPSNATYNNIDCNIDWGDTTSSTIDAWDDPDLIHEYTDAGTYLVRISGTMEWFEILFAHTLRTVLTEFVQLGSTGLRAFSLYCDNLHTCDVSGDTSAADGDRFAGAFSNCPLITSIAGLDTWDVSGMTSFNSMFQSCTALRYLDLSMWVTTALTSIENTFYQCDSLQTLNVSTWDVSLVDWSNQTFAGCLVLESLDISTWDLSGTTRCQGIFASCKKLTELDISSLGLGNCNSVLYMFSQCNSLKSLDFAGIDLSKTTYNTEMFRDCWALEAVYNIDFANTVCTEASRMFVRCYALVDLDMSNWHTVLDIWLGGMFEDCTSLKYLDLQGINSQPTNMSNMFKGCDSLRDVVLANFDLNGVTSLADMFTAGSGLAKIRYDSCLRQWAGQVGLPVGLVVSFGDTVYSAGEIAEAKAILEGPPNNWVITDGGEE
jgi:surface protein